MRIVHFLDCTGHGGDAVAALSIASSQRDRGHDVSIVIVNCEYAGLFEQQARSKGVPTTIAVPILNKDGQRLAARMYAIWSTLRHHVGDVLHLHNGVGRIRTADILAVRALPCRCVVATMHYTPSWESSDGDVRAARRWGHGAPLLDSVVVPSFSAMAPQRFAGVPRLRVIHNPVDVDRMSSGDRMKVRSELGLAPDDTLVLFMARIDPEKSPREVVSAFAELASDQPHVHLAMAGTGRLAGACAEIAKATSTVDRVHFLGHRSDIPDLLKAADIFVHPSQGESFGLSVVEAMAAGLPVITTPVGIIPEIADYENVVWPVSLEQPHDIKRALEELIGSPARRQSLGDRASAVARQFSPDVIAQAYEDLYRACRR